MAEKFACFLVLQDADGHTELSQSEAEGLGEARVTGVVGEESVAPDLGFGKARFWTGRSLWLLPARAC